MSLNVRMLNLEEMGFLEVIVAKQVRHSTTRHMHDSLCIGIIQTGSRQCILPFSNYTAFAGQIIVINPGEVHTCRSVNDKPYNYSMLCVKDATKIMRFLQHVKEELSDMPSFDSVFNDNDLFHKITTFSHLSLSTASLLELQTAFLELFTHLVLCCRNQKPLTKKTDQTAVAEIYHYIKVHYVDEISLQQLSSLFHISPYYLTRCFTKQFGIPPHVCQTLFRIKRAKQLLISGMTPATAAAQTGFVDQSHFYRRFKDIVGMTPGQWLKGRI